MLVPIDAAVATLAKLFFSNISCTGKSYIIDNSSRLYVINVWQRAVCSARPCRLENRGKETVTISSLTLLTSEQPETALLTVSTGLLLVSHG